MSSSVGMMNFPIYGKIKHVPKHQPVVGCIPHSFMDRNGHGTCLNLLQSGFADHLVTAMCLQVQPAPAAWDVIDLGTRYDWSKLLPVYLLPEGKWRLLPNTKTSYLYLYLCIYPPTPADARGSALGNNTFDSCFGLQN